MKRKIKFYFTLPEVTMAIAILGIGLISILGVFPIAIKSGLQAVKVSESIHKARAAANIYQAFSLQAPAVETIPYKLPISAKVRNFAFSGVDNLIGSGCTFEIPDLAKTREGENILDANGMPIPGIKTVTTSFLAGKYQMDRIFMTVNKEFDTYFYVIRKKN